MVPRSLVMSPPHFANKNRQVAKLQRLAEYEEQAEGGGQEGVEKGERGV